MKSRSERIAVTVGSVLLILFVLSVLAHARSGGYEDTPPAARAWFQHLMQPDAPTVSCCGEADAYEADEFVVDGDHYVAIITDTRSDTFRDGRERPHIEPGTHINIPNSKLKYDAGNPTGHGYVFIGGGDQLYCYITPAGG